MSKSQIYKLEALGKVVIYPHMDGVNEALKDVLKCMEIGESQSVTISSEEMSDEYLSKLLEFDGY